MHEALELTTSVTTLWMLLVICFALFVRGAFGFGDGLIDENDIVIDEHSIQLPGFEKAITFSTTNSYQDMF